MQTVFMKRVQSGIASIAPAFTRSQKYSTVSTSSTGYRVVRSDGDSSPPSLDPSPSSSKPETSPVPNPRTTNTPQPYIREQDRLRKMYVAHRDRMRKDFPGGWSPPKKLSREAMDGIRAFHKFDPVEFSTPALAEKFKVSPEAIRRILRSKWTPSSDRENELLEREEKAKELRTKTWSRERGPPNRSKRDEGGNARHDTYQFQLR